jgi:hypothetical protein
MMVVYVCYALICITVDSLQDQKIVGINENKRHLLQSHAYWKNVNIACMLNETVISLCLNGWVVSGNSSCILKVSNFSAQFTVGIL